MGWHRLYEKLVQESKELRELSELDFIELKATLPRKRTMIMPTHHGRYDHEVNRIDDEAFSWMKSLISFNEQIRESRLAKAPVSPALAPSGQPQSREEAELLGYVTASDILTACAESFGDHASLKRYLDRHRHIKTYSPSPNRKMIHAGDLIRALANSVDSGFDGLDHEGVQQRANELRQKRIQERK
jgi:hypothetical protein